MSGLGHKARVRDPCEYFLLYPRQFFLTGRPSSASI